MSSAQRGPALDDAALTDQELITLTLPHDPRFLNVARITVGGLAARLDLPFESLDDLQLAVEAVLADERYRVADEVTIEITVQDRALAIAIGPLQVERLASDLDGDAEGISLRVLLSAVVDAFDFERDGSPVGRLRLDKQVPRPSTP